MICFTSVAYIIQRGVKTIRPKEWGAIFEHVTDPMLALVAETTFEKYFTFEMILLILFHCLHSDDKDVSTMLYIFLFFLVDANVYALNLFVFPHMVSKQALFFIVVVSYFALNSRWTI